MVLGRQRKNGSRFGDAVLEVVINYKCLGLTHYRTYFHCDNGAKKSTLEILRALDVDVDAPWMEVDEKLSLPV